MPEADRGSVEQIKRGLTTRTDCFNLNIGAIMYCQLCIYFTEQGECSLHGRIDPEQLRAGCDSFIERSFRIVGSSGCCGLSGLPLAEPLDSDEANK